jgi:hypothetical protein
MFFAAALVHPVHKCMIAGSIQLSYDKSDRYSANMILNFTA